MINKPRRKTVVTVSSATRPTEERVAAMGDAVAAAAGMVKLVVGVGNNAALAACREAYDHIRLHPRYRVRVKGGSTVRGGFERFFGIVRKYELQLRHTSTCRMFHVADMGEATRRYYGENFTDADYYDMWCGMGQEAYEQTRDFLTVIVNKLRLAFLRCGAPSPEILGWAVAAQLALDMAVTIYGVSLDNAARDLPALSRQQYAKIFKDFDLSVAARFWEGCVRDLDPATYTFEEIEQRNIAMSYEQLMRMWLDEEVLFGSRIKTFEGFADVFRTKGTLKKVVRMCAEQRDAVAARK